MDYNKNLDLEPIRYFCEFDLIWKIEEFRDIPEYEGFYQVSDLGRIKSLSRIVLRKGKFPFKSKEKILAINLNGRGYLKVNFYKDGTQIPKIVHILVAITFLNHESCGFKWVINHKNFIKTDNRKLNLEIVTNRENCNQKHIKSSSQYVGVGLNKDKNKYESRIRVNGRLKYLGVFSNELEASEYYENAVLAIENGTEIKVKKQKFSSDLKGVFLCKKTQKYKSQITIKGKRKHLGTFDTEVKAYEAYEAYKTEKLNSNN